MSPELSKYRIRRGWLATDDSAGFNGAFLVPINGETLLCIASDGLGWQHVSISKQQKNKVPNWSHMCAVKDLFWGEDVWVVQFHPARAEYVNNHPGRLHLWRPTSEALPQPPAELVGIKGKTPEQVEAMGRTEALKIYLEANVE